jgi:serine/threonine-protein kinase
MQLTQTQSLLGTPAYMSPEQMRSARLVDSRSDIWSLGTVMYELVEGRLPFSGESFSHLCLNVCGEPPAQMALAPAKMQAIILRCLAKDPDDRYPNMLELARDLVKLAPDAGAGMQIVDRIERVVRRYSDRTSPVLFPSEHLRMTARPRRRSRWPWLVAAAFAIIGGSTLGVMVSHRDVEEAAPAPAAQPPPQIAAPTPAPEPPLPAPAPAKVEPKVEPIEVARPSPPPTPAAAKPRPVRHPKPPPPPPQEAKKPAHAPCNPYDHMDGC